MSKKKEVRNLSITISVNVSDNTKFVLRGKLKKSGIYDILEKMYGRDKGRAERRVLKLAVINLFANKPTELQVRSWRKMLDSIDEFDKFLES